MDPVTETSSCPLTRLPFMDCNGLLVSLNREDNVTLEPSKQGRERPACETNLFFAVAAFTAKKK